MESCLFTVTLGCFGCLAFVHNHNLPKDKFVLEVVFVFFLDIFWKKKKKRWRFYDLEANKIIMSRDIVFDERKFPYLTDSPKKTKSCKDF